MPESEWCQQNEVNKSKKIVLKIIFMLKADSMIYIKLLACSMMAKQSN